MHDDHSKRTKPPSERLRPAGGLGRSLVEPASLGDDSLDWTVQDWKVIRDRSAPIEFDWFAADLHGNVAVMTSYGVGPSPARVRSSRTRFNALLKFVVRLPHTTNAFLDPAAARGDYSDWREYARQGLFAYDNGDVHAPHLQSYERIARPVVPVSLAALNLPKHLRSLVPVLPMLFPSTLSLAFDLIPP